MSLRSITTLLCAIALAYSWSDTARADNESSSVAGAVQSSNHKLRFQAIVNGRNLQPRDDQLKPLHLSDVTPQEAQMIDRLYQELLAGNSRSPHPWLAAGRPVIANNGPGIAPTTAESRELDVELDGKLNICRGC